MAVYLKIGEMELSHSEMFLAEPGATGSGSPDSISAVLVKGVSIYHRKMKEKSEPSETAQPENGQKSRAVPSALYNLQQEGGS